MLKSYAYPEEIAHVQQSHQTPYPFAAASHQATVCLSRAGCSCIFTRDLAAATASQTLPHALPLTLPSSHKFTLLLALFTPLLAKVSRLQPSQADNPTASRQLAHAQPDPSLSTRILPWSQKKK